MWDFKCREILDIISINLHFVEEIYENQKRGIRQNLLILYLTQWSSFLLSALVAWRLLSQVHICGSKPLPNTGYMNYECKS